MNSCGCKRDAVWDHFTEKKGEKWNRAVCNHCDKDMQPIVARMKAHLLSCPLQNKNEASSSQDKRSAPSPLQSSKKQKMSHDNVMGNFVIVTSDAHKKEIDEQLAKFIFATNSSFRITEHPEFKELLNKLRPGYKPPNRQQIGGELLNSVYETELDKMKPELKNNVVCLSIDGWSNVHNEPIVSICLTTNNGYTYLVDSTDTSGHPHTADYLEGIVHDSIKKIETVYECLVGSVVTDNAANMVLMRKNISKSESINKIISYGCSAHYLNLLAKDFENPTTTKHIERVVKYFRNNHFARAKFNELQTAGNLVLPLEIRWNTMCECLEKYLGNWLILFKICEDHKDEIDNDIRNIVSNISIKRNAEDIISFLKPIASALTKVEANTCTISDAVYFWKELEETLGNVFNTERKNIFRKRYEKALSPSHFAAFMMTPNYVLSNSYKLTTAEQESALNYLKLKFEGAGTTLIPKILKFQIRAQPFDGVLFTEDVAKALTAIDWWKSFQKINKVLSVEEEMIVAQHLTAVASSAGVERIFSTFGFVHSKIRNKLGTEKAAKLVFLYKRLN